MSPNAQSGNLAALAEAYYRRHWERFPSAGSIVGLEEYDNRLEAPDAALMQDQLEDTRATLARFEALEKPSKDASTGELLDRRSFESQLRQRILHLETIGGWRRNPAHPADELITSLFFLAMRRDVTSPGTADAVAARLEAAPAYLAAARSRLTDPVALWVDVALEMAEGGKAFVNEVASGVGEQHPLLKDRLARGASQAGAALEEYAAWLTGLKSKSLSTDPSIGTPALTELVRLNHGLTESLEEISEYGRTQIDFFKKRLAETAKTIDATKTPTEIIKDESRRYAGREPDLLAEYRRITFELKERLVGENVLEMPPGESCEVISTPGFLRPMLPTAAYSAPGPLDRNQRGIFYVSDPPRSLSHDDYLANVAQHFPLDSTCAHEAYPGHHVQLCWANQAPSLIRKLAEHIIFMEGWTLYCEQMMVEMGWYPSRVFELSYLNDQLWRACRIVIDVGVQSGRMTVDQAIAMLQKEVGFTPMRARTELNWYTQSPGTPMSYLLGKGKTLALRDKYRAAHPGSPLKEFHGWLLRHGSIPQAWLLETAI
jgi:uncharacterized protein (DUF885 family)